MSFCYFFTLKRACYFCKHQNLTLVHCAPGAPEIALKKWEQNLSEGTIYMISKNINQISYLLNKPIWFVSNAMSCSENTSKLSHIRLYRYIVIFVIFYLAAGFLDQRMFWFAYHQSKILEAEIVYSLKENLFYKLILRRVIYSALW